MLDPHPKNRLNAICVKADLSLGVMSDADRDATLAYAALHLPLDRELTEAAVNAVLLDFLGAGGSMLRTDHVELRRWLVDTGWLARDGYRQRYRVVAAAPERAAALLGDASAERLDRRVTGLRADAAEARRLRREQHRLTLV